MSKYTTELRFICEAYAGETESQDYDSIENIIEKAEEELFSEFKKYDKIRDYNQEKVLAAFKKNIIALYY